ncbi:glycosyltransferase family 4 protein [Rhizobium sp. S152]|uniref:glycosyltransferase family 4 protein n=1 Tax=Rhizobium sp. S152 TaxID=3055038 RepID=UPI0025A99706|nr:glycosyltransferase family 4 protein [Rhizobium sp. S152]MDM9624873.1 glycosyltransferase family 4 protein [Rhizobium sp. S152]
MKIAYFTNQYPAPSHTFIRREIVALEARGHVVQRYAIRPSLGPLADAEDFKELERTRHVLKIGMVGLMSAFLSMLASRPVGCYKALVLAFRFSSSSRGNLLRHLAYLIEAMVLARWCMTDKVSHLHVHFGTNPATIAALAHEISRVPFSMTVHGPEEFDQPAALGLGIKAKLASFTIAVSSFGRSQLMRWADLTDWHKLHVVKCGIDESYRAPQETSPTSSENRLVCVARLSEQKGHLILLQAASMLARDGVDFQLVLAGDGPLRPQIEREIERLSLSTVVILTGSISQDRVRSEIHRAKAMVLASFAEGLPVVLMESMALKRPAISTYIAGIPELLQPGSGWLVPAGDVELLANAMRAALSADVRQLSEMGERARRLVLEMHDISNSARSLEALIERVNAVPGRP